MEDVEGDGGFVQFRQGLPFFDMVASFMVGLATCPAVFNSDNPMNLAEGHYIAIQGIAVPSRHFRPKEVFDQVQAGSITMDQYIVSCCSMLANTAYESVKSKNDRSPEFEFFRHVRNAASHGNKFHFNASEPARPASWRGLAIAHTSQGSGNPLNGTRCFGQLLGVADIVDLLIDIEAKIAT